MAVAVLVTTVAGCGVKSESALIAEAKSGIEKSDDKSAIIQLKTVLQQNPQSVEARYLLGRTLLRTGDVSGAAVELQKALDLKYADNQVLPPLAEAMVLSGQAKKVTERYGNLTLSDPKAAAVLKSMVASAYLAQGDNTSSAAAIDAALRLDPTNIAAQLLNARRAASRGDIDEALALASATIAAAPKRADALQFKGDLLWQGKSDVDGALQLYRDALAADPRSISAHSALIRLLLQKGDIQGFRTHVASLKTAWPTHPTTRFFDVQLALLDRDFSRAREVANQLLLVAPGDSAALQLAGAVEFQGGSLKLAEAHLVKALQLSPDLPLARRMLAETHLRSGLTAKALQTLQPLLDRPKPAADAFALAAQAHLQSGDLAKAEKYFTLAVQADPADPKARAVLALTEISKGNVETGFAQLEALALKDKTAYADLALIAARLQRNDLTAALAAIERLEAKAADKPLPHVLHGRVLVVKNDLAGARASFEKALAADPLYFPAVQDLAAVDMAEKRPADARKRFDALLARDPKNYQALLAVAELRQSAGEKPEQIEALLLDVVKLNPTEVAPRLVLIEHRLARRQMKAAVATAQESLAAIPDNIQLQDALGRAQLAAGDVRQALSTFNKIAALKPTDSQPLLRLAEAQLLNNDPGLAAQSLRRALTINPDLVIAQQGLVRVAMLGKRVDDALQIAKTVQKQRPKEAIGFQMEGEIYLAQRNVEHAQMAFKLALEREPTTNNATRVHALYAGAGRQVEADRLAESWLKSRPTDAAFLFYLGTAAMTRSDYPSAEARYRQLLALQPDNASTLNNLSWLLVKQGKPGAVAFAEQANKLLPDHVPFIDTLATALAAEKQAAKAIEWQRKAIALTPQANELRLNLARYLAASGDRAAARAELEKLAALGTSFGAQSEVAAMLKSL